MEKLDEVLFQFKLSSQLENSACQVSDANCLKHHLSWNWSYGVFQLLYCRWKFAITKSFYFLLPREISYLLVGVFLVWSGNGSPQFYSVYQANPNWTLRKQNNSSGPGPQQYCSSEDRQASPVMKRRSMFFLYSTGVNSLGSTKNMLFLKSTILTNHQKFVKMRYSLGPYFGWVRDYLGHIALYVMGLCNTMKIPFTTDQKNDFF